MTTVEAVRRPTMVDYVDMKLTRLTGDVNNLVAKLAAHCTAESRYYSAAQYRVIAKKLRAAADMITADADELDRRAK